MYDSQLGLKRLIDNDFRAWLTDAHPDVPFRDVDILTKEPEKEVEKETYSLPAVLIMATDAMSRINKKNEYAFGIFVLTQASSLNKKTSEKNNLELATLLVNWLLDDQHRIYFNADRSRAYQIDREIPWGVVSLTPRTCTVLATIKIWQHTV
jgi:hypothetical protein